MKIISFGWTFRALLGGRKTVTRRDWKPDYAKKFRAGDLVAAYDRSPRFKGKQIATIRLIVAPTHEPLAEMPDSDYEAEGFAYLNKNPHLLPKSMPYDVSWAGFCAWRNSGGYMWVVRFEEVKPPRIGHIYPNVVDGPANWY